MLYDHINYAIQEPEREVENGRQDPGRSSLGDDIGQVNGIHYGVTSSSSIRTLSMMTDDIPDVLAHFTIR